MSSPSAECLKRLRYCRPKGTKWMTNQISIVEHVRECKNQIMYTVKMDAGIGNTFEDDLLHIITVAEQGARCLVDSTNKSNQQERSGIYSVYSIIDKTIETNKSDKSKTYYYTFLLEIFFYVSTNLLFEEWKQQLNVEHQPPSYSEQEEFYKYKVKQSADKLMYLYRYALQNYKGMTIVKGERHVYMKKINSYIDFDICLDNSDEGPEYD
jgi:hypothetical protein